MFMAVNLQIVQEMTFLGKALGVDVLRQLPSQPRYDKASKSFVHARNRPFSI